jgi:rhodanese-related sulfurtransferase
VGAAGVLRSRLGQLPGSLIIERNVLEWRFDPTSDARLPLADYELQVILICQEGYASSLAAASLQDLGSIARRMSSADMQPGVNCCKSFRTPVRQNVPSGRTRMGRFDGRAARTCRAGQIPA